VGPIVILQHEPDDPPANVALALAELGVPFEVRRLDEGDPLPAYPDEAAAVIVMGGSMHVHQRAEHPFLEAEESYLRALLKRSAPIWGICLGAQLLTLAAGGEVYERQVPEIGWTVIEKTLDDPILHGVGSPFVAFEWHLYSCKLPPFGQLIAERRDGLQVFRAGGRAWGTQFHPEVDAGMIDALSIGTEDFAELRRTQARRLAAWRRRARVLFNNFLAGHG
jgi:GMP synthase (glutamine-hydrolysing)